MKCNRTLTDFSYSNSSGRKFPINVYIWIGTSDDLLTFTKYIGDVHRDGRICNCRAYATQHNFEAAITTYIRPPYIHYCRHVIRLDFYHNYTSIKTGSISFITYLCFRHKTRKNHISFDLHDHQSITQEIKILDMIIHNHIYLNWVLSEIITYLVRRYGGVTFQNDAKCL